MTTEMRGKQTAANAASRSGIKKDGPANHTACLKPTYLVSFSFVWPVLRPQLPYCHLH